MTNHRRLRRHGGKGYSALELLVTVAVLAIVTSVAVPGLTTLVVRNRLATQSNALVSAFNLARSEAVTRGRPVALCPAQSPYTSCAGAADWSDGWMLFTDAGTTGSFDAGSDELLRVFDALDGGSRLSAGTAFVRYLPSGFLDGAAGPFTLRAASCTGDSARTISLTPQGRPSTAYASC